MQAAAIAMAQQDPFRFVRDTCTQGIALDSVQDLWPHAGASLRGLGVDLPDNVDRVLKDQRELQRVHKRLNDGWKAAMKTKGGSDTWRKAVMSREQRLGIVSVIAEAAAAAHLAPPASASRSGVRSASPAGRTRSESHERATRTRGPSLERAHGSLPPRLPAASPAPASIRIGSKRASGRGQVALGLADPSCSREATPPVSRLSTPKLQRMSSAGSGAAGSSWQAELDEVKAENARLRIELAQSKADLVRRSY